MLSQITLSEFAGGLIENSVIAVCFVFLLRWVLLDISNDLRVNAKQIRANTLVSIGLFKYALRREARRLKIDKADATDSDELQAARDDYENIQQSLDELNDQVAALSVSDERKPHKR